MASVGLLGFDGALSYYGDKLLPAGSRKVAGVRDADAAVDAPAVVDAATTGERLWLVADPPMARRGPARDARAARLPRRR